MGGVEGGRGRLSETDDVPFRRLDRHDISVVPRARIARVRSLRAGSTGWFQRWPVLRVVFLWRATRTHGSSERRVETETENARASERERVSERGRGGGGGETEKVDRSKGLTSLISRPRRRAHVRASSFQRVRHQRRGRR